MGARVAALSRRRTRRFRGAVLALAILAGIGYGCGTGPDLRPGSSSDPAAAGPRIILRSDPDLEELARFVGGDPAAWTDLPGIPDSTLAGVSVTVWFVRDLSALDSLGLGRTEPWVAGVADPAGRRIALRFDGSQRHVGRLRSVYRHEAAHVALHAATRGNASRWLHEGYAQVASGTWDWREGWRLQFTLMRSGEALLSDLDRRFRVGSEPQTAYILSYTAVDALRGLGGDAGLEALFGALAEGASLDAAFRRVYGLTSRQFEQRWRDRVLDRYGWLYLLSRTAFVWLSVTLLIIALGVARVRRDRRRLRDMKERERRQAEAVEAMLRHLALGGPERSEPSADVDDASSEA